MSESKGFGLGLLGVCLAAGLIVSTMIAAAAIKQVKLANHTITVKGYAEKPITSDHAAWSCSITVEASLLAEAYVELEQHHDIVVLWFESAGLKPATITSDSVDTEERRERDKEGNPTGRLIGYSLSQTIHVEGADLGLIPRVSREATELIKRGIRIASHPPQFFYSKLEEAKVQMLGEAMKNASDRAKALADNSYAKVGRLVQADQGVFQITAPLSTEVDGYGKNDTSSINKVIKAVITAEFSVQ